MDDTQQPVGGATPAADVPATPSADTGVTPTPLADDKSTTDMPVGDTPPVTTDTPPASDSATTVIPEPTAGKPADLKDVKLPGEAGATDEAVKTDEAAMPPVADASKVV